MIMKHLMIFFLITLCLYPQKGSTYSPTDRAPAAKDALPEYEYLSIQDYRLKNTLINTIRKRIEKDPSLIEKYINASFYITRSAFIQALALTASPDYVPVLEGFLADTNPQIVTDAIVALGHIRTQEAESVLQKYAKQRPRRAETASALINALSNYTSDTSADIIASFYNKKIAPIQFNSTVITALGLMGTPYAANILISLYSLATNTEQLMIIENIGYCRNSESARLFLHTIVQSRQHPHFVSAILSLGMLESTDHIPLFLELLHDESDVFVPTAAEALSHFMSPKLVRALLDETDEKTVNSVNRFVYDAIAQMISTWSKDTIIMFITDNNLPGAIAMQLAQLKDPSSIAVLEEILAHEDPFNRLAGLFALEEMDTEESRAAIMKHLAYTTDLELSYMIMILKQWVARKIVSYEEIEEPLSRSSYFREKEAIFTVALQDAEPERVFIYLVSNPDHPMNWLASDAASYITPDRAVIRGLMYTARKGLFRERYHAVQTLRYMADSSQEIKEILSSILESERNDSIKEILKGIN